MKKEMMKEWGELMVRVLWMGREVWIRMDLMVKVGKMRWEGKMEWTMLLEMVEGLHMSDHIQTLDFHTRAYTFHQHTDQHEDMLQFGHPHFHQIQLGIQGQSLHLIQNHQFHP